MRYETIWQFKTAQFRVAFEAAPEDMNPADSFTFDDDIAFANSGDPWAWFCARVSVYFRGELVGVDYLGACSYHSWEDFYAAHRDKDPMNRNCSIGREARHGVIVGHYFPDMVSNAITEARKHMNAAKAVHIRN